MAKRRKKARKSKSKKRKSSAGAWSAAKLRSYKSAKRKLINAFKKKGAKGSVHLSVG